MRMTRAALRAQEAEDELHGQINAKLNEQSYSLRSARSDINLPLIHEDEDSGAHEESTASMESDLGDSHNEENGRRALRDITTENYPVAASEALGAKTVEEPEIKIIQKAKGAKGKKNASKKKDVVNETQETQNMTELDDQVLEQNTETSLNGTPASDQSQTPINPDVELQTMQLESSINESAVISQSLSGPETMYTHPESSQLHIRPKIPLETDPSTSESVIEIAPLTPLKTTETVSKTPKFNPDLHLGSQQDSQPLVDETEDSFVDSIKSRSPAKSKVFNQSPVDECTDLISATPKCSPLKTKPRSLSSSPPRIEDSVEAIDALEDAIEKFAEDLPVLQALSFESPIRSRKSPTKVNLLEPSRTPAKSPVKAATRTPARTPARTSVRASIRTPARVQTSKPATPSIAKTEIRSPQTGKERMASAKGDTVKERVKVIESKPISVPHRRVTSLHVSNKDGPQIKHTSKAKHMATKSVPAISQPPASTMSFSHSPLKASANQPKKRVTSTGTLSTSKPGFAPTKSTKPITTSTFALPGEAIAAKLKAQREERQKKEEAEAEKKTFKARPAPARTARPSVMPRENKASTARLSVRQASGENKENVAPNRSSSAAAPTSLNSSTKTNTVATANSSVRRTTIAPKSTTTIEPRKSMAPISAQTSKRIVSLSEGQQITLTKTEIAQQKLKSKEVYGRVTGSLQQMGEERKAKEEAARKARAEAAERGRQASREWAEKQKMKIKGGSAKIATVEASS